jgi:arylsulfatase A-like enzyme
VPLLLSLCLLLCACTRPGIERIVLVCIERLPAHAVGAYTGLPTVTPTLDRLASEGVRFDVVIAPTLQDRPAHASLLSGLDPPAHGLRSEADAFSTELPTLMSAIGRRGFESALAISQAPSAGDPLASGFEHRLVGGASVAETIDLAISWLDRAPRRYLLTLHLGGRNGPAPLAADEVAGIDAELGRFLRAFEAQPAAGTSLLVVSSARASGGLSGGSLRDEDLRVPLILVGPGLPRGRVVAQPVRLVDIAPTITTLARLSGIPGAHGRSMMPLLRGKTSPWPYAYAEGRAGRAALRTPEHKYIRGDPPLLYDLLADPQERVDVSREHPEVANRLAGFLEARLTQSLEGGGRESR